MSRMLIYLIFVATASAATFKEAAEVTSNTQVQMDSQALLIEYNTDLARKLSPGLYGTGQSKSVLELSNNAEFSLSSAKQWSAYALTSYVCFTQPDTDGCNYFNELGCVAANEDCGSSAAAQNRDLASLCTSIKGGKKEIKEDCFIVSLRQASDGQGRDTIMPWNDKLQEWMDHHNCTALMYHLKYRCYANLIRWDSITAQEELVDIDALFEVTFGMAAVSSFNGGDPLECSGLSENDRSALAKAAQLHVETAVLNFVATATALARFGLAASDITYRNREDPTLFAQDKMRSTLLLNLFYDAGVKPLREWCCAINMCIDYHPMDVLVDKTSAFNTFYPGGLLSLSSKSSEFAATPEIGELHASVNAPLTSSDAYVQNVLSEAPQRLAWEAANGLPLSQIESF